MKVGKPSDIAASAPPPAASGAAAKGARAAERARASDSEESPGVTVSVRARSLIQAEVVAGGDIDMRKVEAVRVAIQQGTFKINPEVIADRLLANAKEMLGQDRA